MFGEKEQSAVGQERVTEGALSKGQLGKTNLSKEGTSELRP